MAIPELAKRLGISDSTAYELVKTDEFPLRPIKIGERVMVSRSAYAAWMATFEYPQGQPHGHD